MIDKKGTIIVEPKYTDLGANSNGVIVAGQGETYGLIINGEFKIVDGANNIWDFIEGNDLTYAKKDKQVGFINKKGEWVIKPTFDKVRAFSNGLAPAYDKSAKKWGYIDKSGAYVIEPSFVDAEIFSKSGLAPVKPKKLWGFIDKEGKMVIGDQYDISVGGFSVLFKLGEEKGFIDGLARVKFNKQWGFLDTKGNVLANTWFQNAELFVKVK
jgi:hypothetical protein